MGSVGAGAFGLVAAPALARELDPLSPALRPRAVDRVVAPHRTLVGEVFEVRRTFPLRDVAEIDPFLLLDHFDFTLEPGQLGGLAPHPHRGFETVTVLFDGAIEHGDSLGNRGRLESGDIQWMTAGRGIVHEENPADDLRDVGGRVLGIQLWVNLPREQKMTAPHYQDTNHRDIPIVEGPGVRARVIAGSAHGTDAVIHTRSPLSLIDYELQPGAEVALEYPVGHTAFVHVVAGVLEIDGRPVPEGHLARLSQHGDGIFLRNLGAKPSRALLGGGEPIGEPIARYGPFVMNEQAELEQAVADYRSGRMGSVANPTYDRIRAR